MRQGPDENLALQYEYYKHWYNIPVRESLLIKNKKTNPENIANSFVPSLRSEDIRQALQTLKDLGMIEKAESGSWQPTSETVRSGDFLVNSMIVNFHLKMMDLAKESLSRFRAPEREIGAVTVALSKESFEKVRGLVQNMKAEVLKLSEQDKKGTRFIN